MKRLLLFWLVLTCCAHAQWRLESSTDAAPLGHNALFVVKTVGGPAKAELKIVIFDEKDCGIRVVANADRKTARPLDVIGRAEKAIAVCNGGYFHAGGDFSNAGLEIAGGVRSDKFTGGELIGALMVRQSKASLVWENEFRDAPDITDFVQCSPWIVSEGRVVPVPPPKEPEQRITVRSS